MNLPPVLDARGRPLDQIRLAGLTVRGFHGVFEHERRDGQEFRVDAVLHLDTRDAAAGDDLTRTVHYGELAVALAEVVRGEPVALLETLVARLAAVCCADDRVQAADVSVHKPHAPVPEAFEDVVVTVRRTRDEVRREPVPAVSPGPLDRAPDGEVPVVLALGANLGDRLATLRAAVADLSRVGGLRIRAASPLVETDPVGGPDQPAYLNAVLLATTSLPPRGVLAACHAVEAAHGRRREVRWGPRTLDVDLVAYDDVVAADDELTVPHPRAAERAFVLAPWAAVDPAAVLAPAGGGPAAPVRELAARAADRDGVRFRPEFGALLGDGEDAAHEHGGEA